MKNTFTKIMAFSSIVLLMLSACNKDGELIKSNGGKAGSLTASTMTPVLDKAQVNNDSTNVITFSFTAANYGYTAAVTNTLQIDAAGDNWANPTSFTLSSKVYSQSFSTPVFNNLLLKLNLPAGSASSVNVRIMHSLSSSVKPIYSNVLSLTVSPFNLTSWVYVPGAYEGSSWPNPGPLEDSLISVTGNGVYTGIINFPSGGSQFLIVPIKGSWAYKYATTGSPGSGNTETFSTEYVASGGNNFQAPNVGGPCIVTLNTNTSTLTVVPADYYSLIGSTTPGSAWSTDTPLKYINDGNNNWSISGVPMTVGLAPNNGFKIRQDDQWSFSWGTSSTAGILTDASGVNIGIATAGNYNVTFNMAPTAYGTAPVVTAAYTLVQQ